MLCQYSGIKDICLNVLSGLFICQKEKIMENRHCETLQELTETIKQYGPGVLYRGQVTNYVDSNDFPSLLTSFQRQVCIPDRMIEWSYYANKALRSLVSGWEETDDIATNQAILQHYGFRSFFLDASGDPRVAAWFASNKYESKFQLDLVEDCFEDPVFLRSLKAWFAPAEGIGNLYLISRKALRKYGVNAVHLSEIATDQGTPRYLRQDAYMVGPLAKEGLRSDCVLCHITAPVEVLRNFAGEYTSGYLFPDPSNDPIYRILLGMPWLKFRHIPDSGPEAFYRSLEIPEYYSHIQKHMPSQSAMYRPFWTRDLPPPPSRKALVSTELVQFLCDSSLYHGVSEPSFILPEINKLLSEFNEVSIELDSLVYHGMGEIYGKGVGIVKVGEDNVCVFEYGLRHPGLRIMDIIRFSGLHYRIDNEGRWQRVLHKDDCTCGSDHIDNFNLLGRVDESIRSGWFKNINIGLYVQQGVDPSSDPRATWGEPY